MTLRQTLAVGAGWLCFARHIKEGRARKRHVAAPSLGGLAKSAFSHCGHSCCLTARTYPRIQMDAGTPAPSAKPSSAQPVSCCSLLRQPGSPFPLQAINTPVLFCAAASSRDEAAHRKPTDSGTEHKGEKHFCSHTYKGNQNGSFEKSLLGKPSLRDTNASGSSKYYGTLVMKRCSAARRARSMLC